MAVSSGTVRVTLPSDEQILITRTFDAPRHLVYRAWTTPGLVKRWWSANRGELTSIDIDLRVGGRWRYAMVTDDGVEVAFLGEYREIVPDERLVYSELLEARPEAEAWTTVTFSTEDGRTTVAVLVEYGSRQDRDAHVEYMQDGLQEAMDLLEQAALDLARGQGACPCAG
jgi:uncharacterized protein YndB with AHSA1/START domain